MNVAVIPARGGSRRIPRKNIVDFHGKPLIAWTIEAALESRVLDRVIVSTDDEEIAQISRALGAEVPFLRTRFADDHTPVSTATIDTVQELRSRTGEDFEIVVQLMPSCPLRSSADIVASYNDFLSNDSAFQLSASKFGWQNPWWAVRLDSQNMGIPLFPGSLTQRGQDLEPLYCPSGAIWMARTKALIEAGTFYGAGHRFAPLEWRAAIDIDDYADLALAAALYQVHDG